MKFLDYIRGKRSGKDAHSLEYDAMSDPFLADAMEGYDSVRGSHADKIAEMQNRISAPTKSGKNNFGAWKIAVAASILIAFVGGYFALMNHESTMLVAQHQDNSYINLYIPQDYIDNKRLELTEQREKNPSKTVEAVAVADIENLHEVIMPVERMTIYIPEAYAQLKKEEVEELSPRKENRVETAIPNKNISLEQSQVVEPAAFTLMDSEPLARQIQADTSMEKDSMVDSNIVSLVGDIAAGLNVKKPIFLSGKVVDEDNEPIPGVAVAVKGTNNATITDVDGNYELRVDSGSADLIANYIGYQTIEIAKAKDNQVIAMKGDNQALDEVVVTAYGVQKRSVVTGSRSSVKGAKEVKPKPLIGDKEYKKYLESNIIRPDDIDCEKKKGKVVLLFYIDSSGRPIDITVEKSLCDAYDDEAIRLVEEGPDWTQGTARVKVEVKF